MANVKVPPFTEAPSTVVGGTPTSVFPFDFPFWAAADIIVYVDGVRLDAADYSVEGFAIQDEVAVEGGFGSGEVTLDTPVSSVTVTIDRSVVGDRETQFSRSVPLGMPALNGDLNRLTARQQDLARQKLTVPAFQRAGKFLAFDAEGEPVPSSGTGADAGLRADLAASGGSALVGFLQSGTGALTRTAQAKIRETISVSDFTGATGGSAAGNDAVGFASAIAEATARGGAMVRGIPGVTYYFNAIVTIPNNVTLDLRGCTVRCTTGSTQTHFFTINGDRAGIIGGQFIGTGQAAPTGAYSLGTYAGTAIYITGGADTVLLDGITFTSFQSGPVLAYDAATAARGLVVRRCAFSTVQTYTTNQTNAVVHLHRCDDSVVEDCQIDTYNWKGFYFANSARSGFVRCHTNGGSGNGFDSSHHLVGDIAGLYSDCFIETCTHRGSGAGFKLDSMKRPVVRGFFSSGQFGGIIQGCEEYSLLDCDFFGTPASSTYGFAVTGLSGAVTSGRITDCTARWSTTPVSGNTGFDLTGASGGTFGRTIITNPVVENGYWGIRLGANGDGLAKAITVINPQFTGIVQYGMICFTGGLVVRGGSIAMTSAMAQSAIFVGTDSISTTGDVIIDGTKFSGSTIRRNVEFGAGLRLAYREIAVRNCDFAAGTRPIEYSGNANAADVVSLLVIENNTGTGLTTGGLSLTFNTTTATKARVRNNSFMDASFVPVADTYTNLTNVIWLEDMAYAGSPQSVFFAAPGTRYARTDGGAGTSLYIKESASSANTGWAAK